MNDDQRQGLPRQILADGFWGKVVKYAKTAGKEVINKALWLYYMAQNPGTPAWAKGGIYGAPGYFILPIDATPDICV